MPRPLPGNLSGSCPYQELQCLQVSDSYPRVACFQREKSSCPASVGSWIRFVASFNLQLTIDVINVNQSGGSSVAEDERKSGLSLQNAKTSVVSRDDETINVRVDLPGKATQKVFDEALTSLARDAPPVPGFRKSKGGRTSNIPSSILLQMLGKSRVTKFVLQEILSITVGDFVKKENLKVNPEIKTTQSEEELESSFTPGSSFSFSVVLQLEKPESDETSENSESDEASEPSS
ncbi:uncharacterized protein [Oryza sativa Japonica Group]|uniref:uncharacterized protein isoform X2 n=1 Tax=Oryza sativa subsp. japonica TaxID=39947 RepID=UPI00339C8DD0